MLLSLSPGPDNLFVLSQSAIHGKKTGFTITLGLCTGLIVHTCAVALGVAALLQSSPTAFQLLKFLGAIYLSYLAYQSFRAKPSQLENGLTSTPQQLPKLYRRGLIMSMSNPKLSIFFLAFLPQFASPANGPMAPQIFLLGALFAIIGMIIFFIFATLADKIGSFLRHSDKAQIYLYRLSGLVFAAFAIALIFAEIN